MRRLQSILASILGDRENMQEERYFMTVTLLTASAFLLVLCIVHIIMNLKLAPVFFAGGSSLYMLVLYYFVRFRKCLFYPKLALTILGLVMLDFTWYAKYLSNGPVLFFILIFSALVIWVWEGRSLAIMISLLFINIAILFVIDYTAPAHLFEYPDSRNRSVDIFISLALYSSLLIFLLTIVKKEFIRQREKAIRSDKLKSAFLANMSHELRTPMNSIVGFSRLLSEGDSTEDRKHYTGIIRKSSDNLLRLINDIIDLSRIEAGDIEIKYSNVNIRELFEELKDIYSFEITRRDKPGIKIAYSLPTGDMIIGSDAYRLKQVLSNLLDNAIKFTDQGEIIFSCERAGDDLEFCVSDTGCGIPEEDRKKIFDQFIRINYGERNTDGSGIGLSIVKKIVEMFKGSVSLESIPGKGSKFCFTLPYNPPSKDSAAARMIQKEMKSNPENSAKSTPKSSTKSILVVEDDLPSYMLIKKILDENEFESHHVSNGAEAIRFVEGNADVGLILMDLKMPVMDGYEACTAIKEIRPDIPIIAQTSYAMLGDKEKAISAGCDDYISKPLDFDLLLELIRKYLKS